MIASVRVADVGTRRALRLLRRAPRPGSIPGLRHADVGLTAPLSRSVLPSPDLRRVGLVAFWDDDDDVDRFLGDSPSPPPWPRGGGSAWRRCGCGAAPGSPRTCPGPATSSTRAPPPSSPSVGSGCRRPCASSATSARAEGRVVEAPGMIWATGMARPPFVATCSLWSSTEALTTYAYGREHPAHSAAIAADQARAFHHRSAFIRFRPYASRAGSTVATPWPRPGSPRPEAQASERTRATRWSSPPR